MGLCEAYAALNYSKHAHTDKNFLRYAWVCVCARGIRREDGSYTEGEFVGGNFFLMEYGVLIELDANTLWCFFERDEHGTIVVPLAGYQAVWSQNLVTKTVTVAAR